MSWFPVKGPDYFAVIGNQGGRVPFPPGRIFHGEICSGDLLDRIDDLFN